SLRPPGAPSPPSGKSATASATTAGARASLTSSCSRPPSYSARIPRIRSNLIRSQGDQAMRSVPRLMLVALAGLALLAGPAGAADKIRVVATTTDLKALTEAVGGDLVEVDALARGNQNPHDLEVRPSLMVKVRRADVIVMNGLELDQWAEVVIQGANNPKVNPGAPGRGDASEGILVLEVPKTRVDRSMGDVHPVGNPHYTADPGMAPAVTANILNGLARVAPQSRATFERNRAAFLARLEHAQARWTEVLAPLKGARVVVDHNLWAYFLTRFGLVQAASVEERPGIP